MTKFLVTTPQLEGLRLSKMHPVVIKSRDGLDLVSYLSFPPWSDGNEDGRPAQPVPLILLVHGGPSDERAQYGYGPFLHWLTNRGYGVLYVNYRGSPGFGKAFVNGQRMEWGGKMHEDLLDQVEWAIAQGITTRDKVAILGGSYGGYATLVGMTMTPEVFACGVDLVGPSNLEIFMPHWDEDVMSKVIGDPRTEEGRAFLRSRSPINFAHQMVHPAPDRSGRQRLARAAGAVRLDGRGVQGEGDPGDLRALSRRGARALSRGEQRLVLGDHRRVPRASAWAAGTRRSPPSSKARARRSSPAPTWCPASRPRWRAATVESRGAACLLPRPRTRTARLPSRAPTTR